MPSVTKSPYRFRKNYPIHWQESHSRGCSQGRFSVCEEEVNPVFPAHGIVRSKVFREGIRSVREILSV